MSINCWLFICKEGDNEDEGDNESEDDDESYDVVEFKIVDDCMSL